jgi:hypothetical protein
MQRFRKPLLILAGIAGGLLLLLLAASLLLASKAKTLAVQQINSFLSVPVQVDDIQFSVFQNFPSASVNFTGVSSKGSYTEGSLNNLATAEKIYLLFNLFDLFSDEMHLKQIIISDADFYLYTDKKGNINYDILKKDNRKSSEATSIKLESVQLNDVHISYIDVISKRDYRILAQNTKLKGTFTGTIHDLALNGPVLIERMKIDGINYLDQKQTEADLTLNIDSKQEKLTITKSTLQVADMRFDVEGVIYTAGENDLINLSVKSKDAGIRELLSLIPGVYTEKLDKFKYDGKVEFRLDIKSKAEKKSTPLVTASFNVTDASLKASSGDFAYKNIYLKGEYTSRISDNHPVSRIRLQNFRAMLENQPLTGKLQVEDFNDPAIDLQLNSKLNLKTLSKFWMPDTLSAMNGMVSINAQIKGKSKDRNSWVSNGTLEASNVTISIKNREQDFTGINGKLTLKGSSLFVSGFKAESGGSDFTMNGNFDNAYGYLLRKSERLNGNLTINSANIDLGELLEDKSNTAKVKTYHFDPDPRIHLTIQFAIGMVQFKKFQAWQMKGKMDINGKIITAENIAFRGFEGNTILSGQINATAKDSMTISCETDVTRLDINTLFNQLGNFGQDVIVAKNVKGKLTATTRFAGIWSKDLHCNLDRIVAESDLLIENGELIDFKPILVLNKYIKGADLQNIKFNTLKNNITISNQTIRIPSMQIESSALDLTASGTHTFSNMVDYKLQLSLSQLMGKRVKNLNTAFGLIEDDGLGVVKVYLTMKGPMEDPKVVFDKGAVEQNITTNIRNERKEFRNIILKEFGLGKKDTAKVKPPPKKQTELELETEE